jgi:hypothetical protein
VRKILILLAGASLILGSACSGDDDDDAGGGGGGGSNNGYSADIEEAFMSQCVPGAAGAPDPQGMCQCAYDKITETVPFSDFEEFDQAVREDPSTPLPPEIEQATTECATQQITQP